MIVNSTYLPVPLWRAVALALAGTLFLLGWDAVCALLIAHHARFLLDNELLLYLIVKASFVIAVVMVISICRSWRALGYLGKVGLGKIQKAKRQCLSLFRLHDGRTTGRFQRALTQQTLDAPDRIAFLVEQSADLAEKFHILRAIVAPSPAPFQRSDLRKLGFPEPQDVLGHIEVVGDLADRSKRGSRLHRRTFGNILSGIKIIQRQR